MSRPSRHPVPPPLAALAGAWRDIVKTPRRRAIIVAWVLGIFGAMLLARIGTPRARMGAGALVVAGVLVTFAISWRERRRLGDARGLIDHLFSRTDPDNAQRAQRALSLAYAPAEGTSEALARLHLTRALSALPKERVTRGAERTALALRGATLVLLATCIGTCGFRGFGVVEGADVLASSSGKAPIDFAYLVDPEIVSRPPEYLHEPEARNRVGSELMLPRGTLITVRGRPVHDGRTLLLTDGAARVPFFDDGSGKLVARWPLAGTVDLKIAALFGDVTIEEPNGIHVQSIADDPPHVTLEGAPREVKLALDTDVSEIPLRYEARDDHGMREVHLVLRAGAKEERRMLAKLDGETRVDRGGSTLRVTDPFVKKSHVPVFVTVEAKDNDAVTGPKWGKSEAIVLVPPSVGEAEGLRLDALRKVRDAFVDSLARRVTTKVPASAQDKRKLADSETAVAENDREQLFQAARASYIGVTVRKRVSALLFTHATRIDKALGAFSRDKSQKSWEKVGDETERFVSVLDAVIEGLAQKDARTSAKELADVADDMATGFAGLDLQAGDSRARVSADRSVLGDGSKSLAKLGALGHDLGEITGAYLLRIDRGDKANDFLHAALAARDLAARLAMPDPSLGAHGKGGHAGAESGGPPQPPEEGESEGDEVAQAFDEAARDLSQLASDHQDEMGNVDKSSGQVSPEDLKQFSQELKDRAEKVRQAVKGLPDVGASPESKEGQARAAREQAEQMAKSLEEENINDALNAGKSAMQHLDEAKRAADRERFWGGDPGSDKKLDEANAKLDPELKATQRILDELRKRAEQRGAGDLGKHGDAEQKLAERMKKLGDRAGEHGAEQAQRDLDDAHDAAKDSANAFKQGDLKRGRDKQREAQKKLDDAQRSFGDDNEGQGEGNGHDANSDHTDIPNADAHKGPEEFRRRVMKGLGMQSPSREKDAVHRYAEGLLK